MEWGERSVKEYLTDLDGGRWTYGQHPATSIRDPEVQLVQPQLQPFSPPAPVLDKFAD